MEVKIIPSKTGCTMCERGLIAIPSQGIKINEGELIAISFTDSAMAQLRKKGQLHSGVMGKVRALHPFQDDLQDLDRIEFKGGVEIFASEIDTITLVCSGCLRSVYTFPVSEVSRA